MKVALVINALSLGGAERSAALLAHQWLRDGHEVSIITFGSPTQNTIPLDPRLRVIALDSGTKGVPPLSRIARLARLLVRLRSALTAPQPEIVISFMDQANILTAVALLGSRTPLIVAERSNPSKTSLVERGNLLTRAFFHQLRILVYRRARAIVTQTERAARTFPTPLQRKIVTIPNPVLAPDKSFAREPRTPPLIVSVGRLTSAKRFDLLLLAFDSVRASHPAASLTIYGEGECRADLEAIIRARGLEEAVTLPGAINDPAIAFREATLFVLCSDFEGYPGVLCEALAHGVPSIARDCDFGPREILDNGSRGILVRNHAREPELTAALADAIVALLNDPSQQRTLSTAGRTLPDLFPLETIARRWLTL